jgi:hypothetical protein
LKLEGLTGQDRTGRRGTVDTTSGMLARRPCCLEGTVSSSSLSSSFSFRKQRDQDRRSFLWLERDHLVGVHCGPWLVQNKETKSLTCRRQLQSLHKTDRIRTELDRTGLVHRTHHRVAFHGTGLIVVERGVGCARWLPSIRSLVRVRDSIHTLSLFVSLSGILLTRISSHFVETFIFVQRADS